MPYVGEIRIFGGSFAPVGWALCWGQTMAISENEALFTLIGTTYGGDGQETFNLPNLQGRVPIHQGTSPEGITYQIGEAQGVEQVTLTVQQIPTHSHALTVSTALGTQGGAEGGVLAVPSDSRSFIHDSATIPMRGDAVEGAGGSQPHENMQPYAVVNFIISLFGAFPHQ
jgi:microcystin-dependent protein